MTSLRTGDALPLFAISYLAFLLLQYAEHAEHQQSQRYACQNHISFLTFSHSACKGSANREKCKINRDLFSFPRCSLPKRQSLKGTNKRAKSKRKTCFSFLFRAKVPSTKSEVRLSEKKTKRILSFLEREYLKTKFKGSANREKCKINRDLFFFPTDSEPFYFPAFR